MNERNRHAAFSDSGRHPLHRAEPHVSAGKNTRHACLEKVGIAAGRPSLGLYHLVSCQHVSASIARDFGRQPSSLRISPDEDE
jgi:hypothetical protein